MSSKVRRALEEVGRRTGVCFRIVFADGSSYQSREGTPDTVITFHRKSAELNVLFFGHIGLLESYFAGGADIDGDIAAAFRAGMDAGFADCPGLMVRLRNRWHEWRFSNGSVAATVGYPAVTYNDNNDPWVARRISRCEAKGKCIGTWR